jgi:hypothetical protein
MLPTAADRSPDCQLVTYAIIRQAGLRHHFALGHDSGLSLESFLSRPEYYYGAEWITDAAVERWSIVGGSVNGPIPVDLRKSDPEDSPAVRIILSFQRIVDAAASAGPSYSPDRMLFLQDGYRPEGTGL